MEEKHNVVDDCLVITLPEELDQHVTERIRAEIDDIILKKRIRYIIMDFKEQNFMDSSGIGFIMGRYKKIINYGGKIYVTNLGRSLERIFHISGLYRITTPVESVKEALNEARGEQG